MKQSWSHKLFLRINAQVGKRPWLDSAMIFCAKWLIGIHAFLFGYVVYLHSQTLGVADYVFPLPPRMIIPCILVVVGLLYGVSLGQALLWRHARPVQEFPNSMTLLHTFGTWKSFPSDHTWLSFFLAFVSFLYVGPGTLLFIFLLFVSATLIAVGRVYVGVHYPRDILGGVALAMIGFVGVSIFFFELLKNF